MPRMAERFAWHEGRMLLTRPLAVAITAIVDKDPECKKRINSGFAAFGNSAGGMRNIAYCLVNWSNLESCKPTPAQQKKVCYGIVEATVAAITRVGNDPKLRQGTLAPLRFAVEAGRNVGEGGEHYATKVALSDGPGYEHYIFDWWATLHTADPLIYFSSEDFAASKGGVTLTRFVQTPLAAGSP